MGWSGGDGALPLTSGCGGVKLSQGLQDERSHTPHLTSPHCWGEGLGSRWKIQRRRRRPLSPLDKGERMKVRGCVGPSFRWGRAGAVMMRSIISSLPLMGRVSAKLTGGVKIIERQRCPPPEQACGLPSLPSRGRERSQAHMLNLKTSSLPLRGRVSREGRVG